MENKNFIKSLVSDFAKAPSDTIAFSIYDGKEIKNISYPQFAEDILKAASCFRNQNIYEQHIALISPNSYDWMVNFFGILASGNTAVVLNYLLPKHMLQQQCIHTDVNAICCCAEETQNYSDLFDNKIVLSCDYYHSYIPMCIDDISDVSNDKTLVLMFTSGTTGKSKAVQLTKGNICSSLENQISTYTDTLAGVGVKDERWFFVAPMFHIAILALSFYLLSQAKAICIGRGARYMFMDMPVFNPTHTALVPAMIESLEKIFKRSPGEERNKYIGSKLRVIISGGAVLKPALAQYMMEQGIILHSNYGMTETTGDGMRCLVDSNHNKAIGKLWGDMECCCVDGEILIRSKSVMKGYYKDPEETSKIIVDGWLHTGDMGYCDEDGYYYIIGRKKNVIILSNGENVNPEEIEAAFGECEAIAECMVYSDGKGICADVFANDQNTAVAYIKQYNESMPLYRQVYKVNYTDEPLPKNATGKIKRKENL